MNSNFDAEKYREEQYKKACEAQDKLEKKQRAFEKKRLTAIHAKLDNTRECVKAGDRKSMLELIEVTADTLLVFDSLSPELRANLANSLKEVINALRTSQGFLPRKRGERSEEEKRDRERRVFFTAMYVEYCRAESGLSLDEAEAKVAEELHIKQDLVHKYWKEAHRKTSQQIAMIGDALAHGGIDIFPHRKKKVR